MNKNILVVLGLLLGLVGCAEMTSLNQKVGDWAGQINQSLGAVGSGRIVTIDDSATSARQIDTLYVRIKREFGFQTRTEALHGSTGKNRDWVELALEENGFVHDVTPGVYYHLANEYRYGYLSITLEKLDKGVQVNWSLKTKDKAKVAEIKQRMLKIIK
ncbi:hypothetical protein A1D23_12995 [Chelonobacter oris]|uniref:hypothetical protein n=1 Tax=Chelonobacter oris TaxID=505317 RepID=UPI0024471CBD|nr:hypothetical protein [Chelonobacter oris]MDH3001456.1 hypothetical protein [Chelonobacter oris]